MSFFLILRENIIVLYFYILFLSKRLLDRSANIERRKNVAISQNNLSNIEMVTYSQLQQAREDDSNDVLSIISRDGKSYGNAMENGIDDSTRNALIVHDT